MTEDRKQNGSGPPPLEPLTGPARRAVKRQRRAKGERALFFHSLALLGTVGWLIVGPLLLGIFCGRWIDHWVGGGVTWTLGGAFAGLMLGSWMVWRRLVESEDEERQEQAAESGNEEDGK